MSKEKQTPCEAAWKKRASDPCCQPYKPGTYAAFMDGFRAGEEGKAALLEACEEVLRIMKDGGMASWEGRAGQMVRAAIAKHTAKGDGQ